MTKCTIYFCITFYILSLIKVKCQEIPNIVAPKCCSTDEILYGRHIKCINSSFIRDNYTIFAEQNYSTLPDCEIELTDLTDSHDPIAVECVDIFFSNQHYYVGVTCKNQNSTKPKIVPEMTFAHITKCCPDKQIFDYESRLCVETDKHSRVPVDLLKNSTRHLWFRNLELYCDHAMVDYEFRAEDFVVENGAMFVNLTKHGKILQLKNKDYCLDESSKAETFAIRICEHKNYCDTHNCLRKCSEHDVVRSKSEDSDDKKPLTSLHQAIKNSNSMKFHSAKELLAKGTEYGLQTHYQCTQKFPNAIKRWWMNSYWEIILSDYQYVKHSDYCLETVFHEDLESIEVELYLCKDMTLSASKLTRAIFTLISCGFMLVTIIIYFFCVCIKNIYGYCFLTFLIHYFLGYFCSALTLMNIPQGTIIGCYWGYITYFFLMSAYVWQALMIYELHASVKHSLSTRSYNYMAKGKRFWAYWIVALVFTSALLCIIITFDFYTILPIDYNPNMSCLVGWFEYLYADINMGSLLYYITPAVFLFSLTLIYLILTAGKIYDMRASSTFGKDSGSIPACLLLDQYRSNKRYLESHICLTIVVMLPILLDILEIIVDCSHPNQYGTSVSKFHYPYDALLTFQGVAIFFIYVYHTKVLKALRRRCTGEEDYIEEYGENNRTNPLMKP